MPPATPGLRPDTTPMNPNLHRQEGLHHRLRRARRRAVRDLRRDERARHARVARAHRHLGGRQGPVGVRPRRCARRHVARQHRAPVQRVQAGLRRGVHPRRGDRRHDELRRLADQQLHVGRQVRAGDRRRGHRVLAQGRRLRAHHDVAEEGERRTRARHQARQAASGLRRTDGRQALPRPRGAVRQALHDALRAREGQCRQDRRGAVHRLRRERLPELARERWPTGRSSSRPAASTSSTRRSRWPTRCS